MSSIKSRPDPDDILAVAARVNWYTPVEEVIANTSMFLAQIMARGCEDDHAFMLAHYSMDEIKDAYINAAPGLFEREAWAHWGEKLFGRPDAYPWPVRFPDFDAAVECWLREEVVQTYDAMEANPARAIPAKVLQGNLRSHHFEKTLPNQ